MKHKMKNEKPLNLRWSKYAAEVEFGVESMTLRKRLGRLNIKPGPDGKYSTREMFLAVMGDPSSLESKAKIAKWERIIEEAEEARARRIARRDSLALVEKLKAVAEHLMAKHLDLIRSCPMSEKEKNQAVALLSAIEFNPIDKAKKK